MTLSGFRLRSPPWWPDWAAGHHPASLRASSGRPPGRAGAAFLDLDQDVVERELGPRGLAPPLRAPRPRTCSATSASPPVERSGRER